MRIGLFGGAFDPITTAHIHICNYLTKIKSVDEIWILPCYRSGHGKYMTKPVHRFNMCKIAAKSNNNQKIKVCDFEIKHKITGSTASVLKQFYNSSYYTTRHDDFRFIIGMDNALGIKKWTNYEITLGLIPFIVVNRGDHKYDQNNEWFEKSPHKYVEMKPPLETSSSQVRDLLQNNLTPKDEKLDKLIDKSVLDYIKIHTIYF